MKWVKQADSKYLDSVQREFEKAFTALENKQYEKVYDSIIRALDNFGTQYGSDFHLEYTREKSTDLLGQYLLEVDGVRISPDNMEENEDIVFEAIQNALAEIDEDRKVPDKESVEEE